jgi:phage gp36-like protein
LILLEGVCGEVNAGAVHVGLDEDVDTTNSVKLHLIVCRLLTSSLLVDYNSWIESDKGRRLRASLPTDTEGVCGEVNAGAVHVGLDEDVDTTNSVKLHLIVLVVS